MINNEIDLEACLLCELKKQGFKANHNHKQKGDFDIKISLQNGKLFFIECKYKNGRLSKEQEANYYKYQNNAIVYYKKGGFVIKYKEHSGIIWRENISKVVDYIKEITNEY